MLRQYVVDPAVLPWKHCQTEGITFRGQVLLDGAGGGPEAFRFQFDPCLSVYAHMHLTAQFQLVLGGAMDLPRESMKLRPPAVHYTDHYRPYGPFSVSAGHDVLVLHPKRAGLVSMRDRAARKLINLKGRELSGMDKDAEWLRLSAPGYEGSQCKVLIPHVFGPEAVMLECPPNTVIALEAPIYGRYEVVLKGAALVGGRSLGPPGFRYVHGDERPASLQAGPDGATLMFLSFDKDALEGGITGEGITVAAAEAMARAI